MARACSDRQTTVGTRGNTRPYLQSRCNGFRCVQTSNVLRTYDIKQRSNNGIALSSFTRVGIAAQEGHEHCVRALLNHGADPSHSDHCGRNAIKVAAKSGHDTVVRLLEEHAANQRSLKPTINGGLLGDSLDRTMSKK